MSFIVDGFMAMVHFGVLMECAMKENIAAAKFAAWD